MNKAEKLKQIKEQQRKLAQQLENDDRAPNPNYKKGRRSASEIFNGIDRRVKYI